MMLFILAKIGLVLNIVGTLMIALRSARILPTLINWMRREAEYISHHSVIQRSFIVG